MKRRGWSVGRVLFPGALRRSVRRPSISDRRYRRPPAVHPRTRAGSPRACAVRPCSGRGLPSRSGHPDRWWSLAPPFHPYLNHRRPRQARPAAATRRSVLCGTVPRVAPGGCCPPPCPSEPGPSSTHVVRRVPRPPDQPLRAGHRRARRRGLDRLDPRGALPARARPTSTPGRPGWADPAYRLGQLVVSAVSSTTNEVWRDESSVPLNEIVTVCPAKDDRLNDFWL